MLSQEKPAATDFAKARFHMVEGQLRPNKVTDRRILDAMGSLPREIFLQPLLAGIAYSDEDVEIAPGRYLMEPMILARLLQDANLKPTERVLDIASATGYSAVVAAALARTVTGIESEPSLQKRAQDNLGLLGIDNATIALGPLANGSADAAPYDVILINGSVEFVPDTLFGQLAEGGRLVTVMRRYGPARAAHTSEARLFEKVHGAVSSRSLFDANIQPLPGFQTPVTFTF
ncbi:MAG: protein-L-isoaspartate O-methyltransferase [Pseudomonadota bacterium]|nr:protein-L-isoaspartate O-methyltransferase [Pseudomonadota bacterium]